MALMIHDGATPTHPSRLHEDIFNILQSSPHTRDWVVFYQKEVSEPDPWIFFREQRDPKVRGPFNIDFIIYIPAYCSVICLGVENDLGNAMYALREQYFDLQEDGPLSLSTLTITAQDSQTADADQLVLLIWRNRAARELSEEDFKSGQREWEEVRNELEGIEQPPETIFRSDLRSDLETLRPQLLRLTEEQVEVLNTLNEETRYVIDGAAGTGKTVLAQELAKRRCEAGDTVALMCSNPNLIHHLEQWAEKISKGSEGEIVAGTPATLPSYAFEEDSDPAHRHTQRLEDFPDREEALKIGYLGNFKAKWPSFVDETVKDLGQGGIFDYLIVDEAQNLCDEDKVFLRLMDKLLKGGLTKGRFTMFGDFKNQNILFYSSSDDEKDGRDYLDDFIKRRDLPERIPLETNCRNTQQIHAKIVELTFLGSPPLDGVHGPEVEIEFFSGEEWRERLNHLVHSLKERKFDSQQIILLTAIDDGEFNAMDRCGGWKLSNISEASSDDLRCSDIYDFQGLESDVAILVIPLADDQVTIGGSVVVSRAEHLRKMLYTGMSRAKAMLFIVAHEDYRSHLS